MPTPHTTLRKFVAKVDPFNSNERELFRARADVPLVQMKYSDSHWLLDNPIDDLLDSNQQLILVDWEDEENLIGRNPHDVFQRCIEFEDYIAYVYLGDRWTYEKMSPRQNRKQINWSIGVQRKLGRWFREVDADFEFNPMLLGWKRWHLERHRGLVEDFGNDLVGFDATGYRSKYTLAADVNRAIETLDLQGMYVSGRCGGTHLAYLPAEVKAFSGKSAILKEVRLDSGDFSQNLLGRSIEQRIRAFDSPQTELRQFIKATS